MAYDKQKLESLRLTAFSTIKILNLIDQGWRSQTRIAARVGCDRRRVDYYFKLVKLAGQRPEKG